MIAIETVTQNNVSTKQGTTAWASELQREKNQQPIKKNFSDESLNQLVENFSQQQKHPSVNSNFLKESFNNVEEQPIIVVTGAESNKQPLLAPFLFEYDFLSGTRKSRSNSEVSNCNKAECLKNAQDYDQDESVINIYLENHEHLEQDWNSRKVLDTSLNSDEEELYIPKQALELSQSLPRFPFLVDQFPSSQIPSPTKSENSFDNNQITQQEQLQKESIEDLSLNFSYFLLNHAPKYTNDSYGNELSSMICGTNIEWGFSSMISSSIAFKDVQPSFRDEREFRLDATTNTSPNKNISTLEKKRQFYEELTTDEPAIEETVEEVPDTFAEEVVEEEPDVTVEDEYVAPVLYEDEMVAEDYFLPPYYPLSNIYPTPAFYEDYYYGERHADSAARKPGVPPSTQLHKATRALEVSSSSREGGSNRTNE
ncbi:3482_t:CDS:2, partial [Ambispora leptoticha]